MESGEKGESLEGPSREGTVYRATGEGVELISRNLTNLPTERLFEMALKAQEEGQRVAPAPRLGVEEDVMASLNKSLEKSWIP